MAVTVFKTFASGEVLTASDLNSSFTQIVNNGTDVAFPATKAASMGGFALGFDATAAVTLTSSGTTNGLNLAGGALNTPQGTDVASATTTNLETATGNVIDVTGTTTITAITLSQGHFRIVRFTGALVLTHSATLVLPGSANITTTAGDYAIFVGYAASTVRCVSYSPLGIAPTGQNPINLCEFRLSLTTALPVTTADVTGATTVYAVPYKGNRIALYDGANWNIRSSAEFSLALGTLTSGLPYDVFCYDNSGVPTLEFLAWTNDTTRATALTTQNGVLSKTGALTRRYLGTFYTTSTTQTEDSYAKRFLWNYYHRVRRPMRVLEATDSWTYTTFTIRQARASTANQLDFVVGVSEDSVSATVYALASNSTGGVTVYAAVGFDSTTTFTSGNLMLYAYAVAAAYLPVISHFKTIPAAGRHYMAWNEQSAATGTTTWGGDAGSPTLVQAGIHGEVMS